MERKREGSKYRWAFVVQQAEQQKSSVFSPRGGWEHTGLLADQFCRDVLITFCSLPVVVSYTLPCWMGKSKRKNTAEKISHWIRGKKLVKVIYYYNRIIKLSNCKLCWQALKTMNWLHFIESNSQAKDHIVWVPMVQSSDFAINSPCLFSTRLNSASWSL